MLGFDTSTAATSVCVLGDDGAVFERWPPVEALFAPPSHARELMPAIAESMGESGLSFADLDAIAVGIGPGTFTGLRIGVATARALSASTGVELRPVSSLAALAQGIDADLSLPLIDARRGEVFAALYAGERRVWEPFAASAEQVAARARAAGLSPRAVGDGSVRFRSVLEAAGIRVDRDGSRAHVVRALHVCRLGAAIPPAAPGSVLPEYLRLPDATPRKA